MSDYARAGGGGSTHFGDKDSLSTGDDLKVIVGSQFDSEFNAIVTAVATKYDSNDLASQAQAEALTSNAVLMTPLRVANVLDENGGLLGEIQLLADPAADGLLMWDDSQSASSNVQYCTAGTGLAFSTTTIALSHLAIESLTDPGADRILFWDDGGTATGWLTVSTGLDLTTTNLTLSHLAIESLTDPGADRILFWDDGGTASGWLQATSGVEISGTTLILSTVSAGANNIVDASAGTFTTDITATAAAAMTDLAVTDSILVDDGGVAKHIDYNNFGFIIKAAETTGTLALIDANTIMEFDGTATLTIPLNATVAWPVGVGVILVMDHATQVLTITADTSVTLNSVFHPGGGSAASDTLQAGGMAALIKTAADEWYLSGDIST